MTLREEIEGVVAASNAPGSPYFVVTVSELRDILAHHPEEPPRVTERLVLAHLGPWPSDTKTERTLTEMTPGQLYRFVLERVEPPEATP